MGFTQMTELFDPQRFLDAQEGVFENILQELARGRKSTHWMWYVFPQADGLGQSDTSRFFALKSMGHAVQYVEHAVLGPRLVTCTRIVNEDGRHSAATIFGKTDALKFWSSMTLFSLASPSSAKFHDALRIFFDGVPDEATLRIVEKWR